MLKYKLTLINVWWNENSIDTRYFNNLSEQDSYFDNLTKGIESPFVNFNMGDNISTTIIYRDNSNRDISELIKCNYLVLKKYDDNDLSKIIEKRYYFAQPYQDSNGQLIVQLKLDSIQTNYFKYKNSIKDCIINRACLDRFIPSDNNKISFNGDSLSNLYENESDDKIKRLIKRQKINFNHTGNIDVDEWLNKNVACWCYVFIDSRHPYNVKNPFSTGEDKTFDRTTILYEHKNGRWRTDYGCIAFPIFYDINKRIILEQSNGTSISGIWLDYAGYEAFRQRNDNASYFYSMKLSLISPLDLNQISSSHTVSISNDELTIKMTTTTNSDNCLNMGFGLAITPNGSLYGVLSSIQQFNEEIESSEIDLDYQFNFNKNEIIGSSKNIKFNPKMLSSNYKELQIVSSDGERYSYDIQKINNNKIKLLYTEPIQAEITKTYTRLKATGLYTEGTQYNYTGVVTSSDFGLSIENGQLSQFLANNRNFWLQSNLKIIESGANTVLNSGGSIKDTIQSNLGNVGSAVERKLNIDNMRYAPSSLKSASGNVTFNQFIDKLGMYIEIYECLYDDCETDNDYMVKYGYKYGHIGNISNFDNIRKYFNYISADVECITAPISNLEKEDLISKLKSIRFWNSDNIQYDLENYERWLD